MAEKGFGAVVKDWYVPTAYQRMNTSNNEFDLAWLEHI